MGWEDEGGGGRAGRDGGMRGVIMAWGGEACRAARSDRDGLWTPLRFDWLPLLACPWDRSDLGAWCLGLVLLLLLCAWQWGCRSSWLRDVTLLHLEWDLPSWRGE